MKKFFLSLGLLLGSMVFICLILEIGLRFFPVNQTLRSMPVNDHFPVLRFEPNRTTIWSKLANFCLVNSVHANNYGFINNLDYEPSDETPLVAVVGDSFVEALMVPWGQTIQGDLSQQLEGRMRVYSFARSGAPLSQYVAYAEWASREFRPQKLVVVVVSNDYDESLIWNKSAEGFHYYDQAADESLELLRVDYEPGLMVNIVSRSHLLMYLLTNVRVLNMPQQLRHRFLSNKGDFVGQTGALADADRVADSMRAVDAALIDFPRRTGMVPGDICFVVDGLRPNLYSASALNAAQGSYAQIMRDYFMKNARAQGYSVVDMQPVFMSDYDRYGELLEPECDGHWNARAHGLAAKAVLQSGFLEAD